MRAVVRAFGALALLVSAVFVSKGYSAYAERRLKTEEELLLLIRRLRTEISCRLTGIGEIVCGFSGELLSKSGFISRVRAGETVGDAWKRASGGIPLSPEIKRLLDGYFAEVGREYREGELAAADRVSEELTRLLKREREELPKSVKTVRLLAVSAALGITILLI